MNGKKELKTGKKLIVTDLDGTLLDHVERLSTSYASRLNVLLQQGLDFTVCTGRDFENTQIALQSINFKNPIVLTNGAILCDYPSGKVVQVLTINHQYAVDVLNTADKLNINAMVFASHNLKKNETRFIKGKWWDPKEFIHLQPEQYMKYAKEPIISIQFCDDKEKLDLFYDFCINHFDEKFRSSMHILYFEDAFLPGKYWLEFNPIDAKKEFMLQKLIELKGYQTKDIVVFGDQKNDIGMLKMAGIACTVENASDEVKKIADYVIPSNLNGGVIDFLEKNFRYLI